MQSSKTSRAIISDSSNEMLRRPRKGQIPTRDHLPGWEASKGNVLGRPPQMPQVQPASSPQLPCHIHHGRTVKPSDKSSQAFVAACAGSEGRAPSSKGSCVHVMLTPPSVKVRDSGFGIWIPLVTCPSQRSERIMNPCLLLHRLLRCWLGWLLFHLRQSQRCFKQQRKPLQVLSGLFL